MSDRSKISWTDATWNPVRGCSPVSAGCKNCYAARMASRFSGPGKPYEGLARDSKWTGKIRLVTERLGQPLRWRKPRWIFVNSMSDLFHEDVPFAFVKNIRDTIAETPRHTFQILTKRPQRLLEFTRWMAGADDISTAEWPRNAWLGCSVENQETADERIPLLLQTPAALWFASCEPLLGPLDLRPYLHDGECRVDERIEDGDDPEAGSHPSKGDCICFGDSDRHRLNWVIVGGESGPGARPTHPDWVRSIRDQCQAAGVPLMFKQWGEWAPIEAVPARVWKTHKAKRKPGAPVCQWDDGQHCFKFGKKAAGRRLDGREWMEMPG